LTSGRLRIACSDSQRFTPYALPIWPICMTRYKVRYCALTVPKNLRLPEDIKDALYAACTQRCAPRTRALAGRLAEVVYANRASGICVLRVAHEIFCDVRRNALPALGAYLQRPPPAPGSQGDNRAGLGGDAASSGIRVIAVSGSMLQLSKRLCPVLAGR